MSHPPLTFLFCDLEGSTRLWEQFPEEMQSALARHDALLKHAVSTHNGRIVKLTGDGLHAVFESPADGIAAALAGQQALLSEPWSLVTGPLKVRMGIHSGASQERDGDYYGPALNRAVRIMAAGNGGQILVSNITAMLGQDLLPSGAFMQDLGEHLLPDLAQPEHIFQLCHPSLPTDFPALDSLSAYKHNLPMQLSSFIGRAKELREIQRLLAQTRLLTLLGPGGTGKTRLALQASADVIDHFPEGVWLVELAPLTDPEALPDRLAAVFHLQEQPGRAILDTLTDHLRRKKLLLVIDNVEHLVRESAELVEHLLSQCPGVKVLVTGREALFIRGETTLQIPSLSLPNKENRTPEHVADAEAVQLFLTRAQEVRPDFEITAENTPAIVEIVRRLDGIPLALELAAARLRMMSVEQIAERLNDRFRLLTGGNRTALPRQQTLQALIDWSWNLLDENEAILIRRLAVFSGGWTLEAAQAVASDDQLDEFEILNLLEQLINKSLVNVEHLPQGEVRYSMLESIRQFARERLFESGEGQTIRARHAEYFTLYSEQISKALEGRDMLLWLDRFLRETDNARTAQEWALASRLDLALRLASAAMLVQRYWLFSTEGRRWLREVVEEARSHPAVETDPQYQRGFAAAVISLGAATLGGGETAQAPPILEEGIKLAKAAGAVESLAFGLNMLLIALLQIGDFESASRVAEEALDISRQHDLHFMRLMTLGSFTPIFSFQGKHAQARAYTEEAIQLARKLGNPWTLAMAAMLKGHLERYERQYEEAYTYFMEAADLFAAVRDTPFSHISRSEAGHIKRLLGDYTAAEQIYCQTILFFLEGEGRSAVIHQLECFGICAAYLGRHERAAILLGAAQGLRESESSVRLPHEQNEFDQALAHLVEGMGEGRSEAAMLAGGSLTFDEAVDYALSVDPERGH